MPEIPHFDDITNLFSIDERLGERRKFKDFLEGILAYLDDFIALFNIFEIALAELD